MNTKTVTLLLNSQSRPGTFVMVKDSVWKFTIAAGVVAAGLTVTAASITDESGGLTIASASISSPNATLLITAGETGCFPCTVSATIGSTGEIFKSLIEIQVVEAEPSSDDYG